MTGLHVRRLAAALLAVVAGPVAGAPHARAAQSFAEQPAVKALYDKAKAETEVDIWGPAPIELQWIPGQFAKRFPGIAVKWNADLQAGTKIIAEARAGRHTVDAWSNSLGGLIEVQKRGLLAKIDWASFGIARDDVFFDGEAAATHNFVYSVVYAKDHAAATALPGRWQDLATPPWRDKLAASDFLLPRLMGFLALEWGPEATATWARTLIAQERLLVSNAPLQNFLKTGERLAAVADPVSNAYYYSAQGVPSGYRLMDIVPATQFVIDVFKDAPHPNAARLLAAWLASPEGRGFFDTLVHEPDIRPGSQSALAQEIRSSGAKVIFEDVATMGRRADYYKTFSALVRGQQ